MAFWSPAVVRAAGRLVHRHRCKHRGPPATFSRCRLRRRRRIVALLAVSAVTLTLIQLMLSMSFGRAEAIFSPFAPSFDWLRSKFLQAEEDELARRLWEIDNSTVVSNTTSGRFRRRFNLNNPDNNSINASVFTWRDVDGSQITCFRSGVDSDSQHQHLLHRAQLRSFGRCRCKRGWYGRGCSIPEIVWRGRRRLPFSIDRLTLRRRPHRVVQAMPFSAEFDLFDVRLAEIGDVVDVFLVVESNYTSHGDRKPFKLRDRLMRTSGCNRLRRESGRSMDRVDEDS